MPFVKVKIEGVVWIEPLQMEDEDVMDVVERFDAAFPWNECDFQTEMPAHPEHGECMDCKSTRNLVAFNSADELNPDYYLWCKGCLGRTE